MKYLLTLCIIVVATVIQQCTTQGKYSNKIDVYQSSSMMNNNCLISIRTDVLAYPIVSCIFFMIIYDEIYNYSNIIRNTKEYVSSRIEVNLAISPIVPPVITLSHVTNETYDILPPDINRASITVLSSNVTLQTNVPGKWQSPNDVNTTDNMLTFPVFSVNHDGLYRFYADMNGSEVLSIQIYISAIGELFSYYIIFGNIYYLSTNIVGSNFAELIPPDQYTLLLCNEILYANSTIVCATNDTSKQIQWSYKSTQKAEYTNIQNSSTWDVLTGISTLQVMTSQQGYYSCEVGDIVYTAAIFDPTSSIGMLQIILI